MTVDRTLREELVDILAELKYDLADAILPVISDRVQAAEERASKTDRALVAVGRIRQLMLMKPDLPVEVDDLLRALSPVADLLVHLISFEKGSWSKPRARAVCVCGWKGEWSWSSTCAEAEGNLHLDMIADPNQEPPGYSGGVSELGYEGDG